MDTIKTTTINVPDTDETVTIYGDVPQALQNLAYEYDVDNWERYLANGIAYVAFDGHNKMGRVGLDADQWAVQRSNLIVAGYQFMAVSGATADDLPMWPAG